MSESKIAVFGAIGANIAIAASKFIVAGITGSSVMISEGIHSTVDTFNGFLLLLGLKFSRRPPTPEHPFGHGKELYFWSLIVAVLIFGVGGGISAYEGILHMRSPVPMQDPFWNYLVLGIAAAFEGGSFLIALRQLQAENETSDFREALRNNRDPSTLSVVAEDGAALAGLAIAAVGTLLSQVLEMPVIDGAASTLIGALLCGVAILLMRQLRGLLVGEGIRPDTSAAIRRIVLRNPSVCKVGAILGMYMGADDILLTLDVEFQADTTASEVAHAVDAIEKEIRTAYPKIKRIYIEGRSLAAAVRGPG
ncbi:cation diffusion facilitator family transporter [Oxalobacteraceae bacterium CAVE-383]|nr:cation diffusion facilitator family transporter [Oxalobacteraceae bacterium CAVE-383]